MKWPASMRIATLLASLIVGAALPGCANDTNTPSKTLYVLTLNLPHMEEEFALWTAEFRRLHPDFTVRQIDRKGSSWAAYYNTQVIAGSAPDVIDTQGGAWLQYAAQGGLRDLTPYLQRNPEFASQFYPELLASWTYAGKNFGVPLFFSKSLLFYNKKMFREAGISAPPTSFDELMKYAYRLSGAHSHGFMTLNFDWLYWSLFAMNGVELVNANCTRAVFNTPAAVDLVEQLAKATAAGAISSTSWTGRWVEPNSMFAAGGIGMYNAHSTALLWMMSNAKWIDEDSIGFAQMPGNWSVPNAQALHISTGSRYPDEAWDFIRIATSGEGAFAFGKKLNSPTGNKIANERLIRYFERSNPLVVKVLATQFAHLDRLVGNWPIALDTQVKYAFYPELQSAVLGQKTAAAALASAERKVNHILARPGALPGNCQQGPT